MTQFELHSPFYIFEVNSFFAEGFKWPVLEWFNLWFYFLCIHNNH